MACFYRKNRSQFRCIQYIVAGKIKHDKSTGLRADISHDTIKAKIRRAQLEAREHQMGRLRLAQIIGDTDRPLNLPPRAAQILQPA